MRNHHAIICIPFIILLFLHPVSAYERHGPIIIRQSVEGNSASNPLIIEGYDITNPTGPCIFIENIEYVIIRNNTLHQCGTDISLELIAHNPRDDDCVGRMSDFMVTGAINLFRVGSVQIYDNALYDNDYGIRVDGFDRQIDGVSIYNNKVHNTHRGHFVWVKNGDHVSIHDNDIRDNGLGEFFDNAALLRILSGEDLNCGDGRSQGIAIHRCNNVRVYENYVFNSSSDGIGIMGDEGHPSTNIEVYRNEVVENGEQGIWLAGAHNISIYENTVYQSKQRIDEQGGSSGIMIETDSVDVRVFENEMYYNDMYGLSMTAGTNISIYDNDIYYNGDGGIGILHLDYIGKEGIKNISIIGNHIHDNRKCAIDIGNDYSEDILIKGNTFEKNGGNPIHHGFYADHDFSLHLGDWVVTTESVLCHEWKSDEIIMQDNTGHVDSIPEKNPDKNSGKTPKKLPETTSEKNPEQVPETIPEKTSDGYHKAPEKSGELTGIPYVIEQLMESWKATVGVIVFLFIIISLTIYYKRKNA